MKKVGLEFFSSFFYLFIGCLFEILVLKYFPWDNFLVEVLLISMIFAFSFAIAYIFGNMHEKIEVNPIFTFSLWLRNQIPGKIAFVTILSQCLGAILAGFVLSFAFHDGISDIVAGYGEFSMLNASLDNVILIEFIFSFILVFCYLTMKDKISSSKLSGIMCSLLFLVLLFFSIPYTGGCVNPNRSLVSNIFVNTDSLRQIWIYVLSSLAGTVFATIIYHIYYQISNKVSLQHFS